MADKKSEKPKKDIVIGENRRFEGIWIPKRLYLTNKFTPREKFFLVEIKSLSDKNGCYAQNKHFAEFLGVSESHIHTMLQKLKKDGYIELKFEYEGNTKAIKRRFIVLTKAFLDEFINEKAVETGGAKNSTRGGAKNSTQKYNNKSRIHKTLDITGVMERDFSTLNKNRKRMNKVFTLTDTEELYDICDYFFDQYFEYTGREHGLISEKKFDDIVDAYHGQPDTMHAMGGYSFEDCQEMIREFFENSFNDRPNEKKTIMLFFNTQTLGILYERVCR